MATDGNLAPPSPDDFATDEAYRAAQQTYGLLTGQSDWGAPVSLTSYSNASTYAQTIDNQGAGGLHLNVPGIMTVTDTGVAAGVVNGGTVNATTLNVTGTSTLATVNASGLVTLSRAGLALTVTNDVLIGGTLEVTGLTTLGALTATGNVALGDANADVHTVIGVTTFRNAANTATQALFDAGNNRVIVGSSTALNPDTTPCLQVVGRLYVAPETANDFALELRRSSAATVGWDVGVTSTNDLVFKDLTGTETFRAGAVASAFQAKVVGALNVSNGLSVNASGILVSAGGLGVTGSSVFNSGLTVLAGLTVTTGELTLSAQPRARVYNSAAISHTTSGAWQSLTYDTERYDVGGLHAAGAATFVVVSAGSYLFGGCASFTGSALGTARGVRLLLNGATVLAHQFTGPGTAAGTVLSVVTAYDLAATDTVALQAFQDTGGALNLTAVPNSAPEFWINRYA